MNRFWILIFVSLISYQIFGQDLDLISIKSHETGLPIKNVNILSINHDTVLITDTLGSADLRVLIAYDTLIIKKFGYHTQVLSHKLNEVELVKDSTVFSHDLKLLDLKHTDGLSFIQLKINGDNYWFKQKYGPLFLGNGRELESSQDYIDIFQNHEILKTVAVTSEYCLWKIRGENSANWITAIYYKPELKKRQSKKVPATSWYSKRDAKRDCKVLKLCDGCLD